MDIETYRALEQGNHQAYQRARHDLNKKYAMSHNFISKGMTVTDHIGTIKVDIIGSTIGSMSDMPQCVYGGPEYTKAGKPRKDGNRRRVYQNNIKESAEG